MKENAGTDGATITIYSDGGTFLSLYSRVTTDVTSSGAFVLLSVIALLLFQPWLTAWPR